MMLKRGKFVCWIDIEDTHYLEILGTSFLNKQTHDIIIVCT